jgi:hypothetical protein
MNSVDTVCELSSLERCGKAGSILAEIVSAKRLQRAIPPPPIGIEQKAVVGEKLLQEIFRELQSCLLPLISFFHR